MTWKTESFNTPADAVTFMNANSITLAECLPIINIDGQYVLYYYN